MAGAVDASAGRSATPNPRAAAELHHEGPPAPPRYRGALLLVVLLSAVTWAVFAVLDIGDFRETADLSSLNDIVDTATMLLAAVVGVLAVLQYRLRGESDDLAVGVGLIVLGLVTIGFDNLVVPRVAESLRDDPPVRTVAPLGFAVAFGFIVAPVAHRRRAALRRRYVIAGFASVGLLLGWAGPVSEVVAGRRAVGPLTAAESVGQAGVVAFVGSVAVAYWVHARREGRTFHAWVALTLFGLAQSRGALALAFSGGPLWLAGSRILRLEAVSFALMGMNRELHEGFTRQASELRTSKARVRSMEAQRHAEQAAQAERRHDVRSSLFAIGGVADLLGRSHEDLDAGTLEALTQALGAEVQRLQGLVAEQEREELVAFSLLETVSPLVVLERSSGLALTCTVNERLFAVGRPKETTQVLRNLLDNARKYAPGAPVSIRGEERDGWAVLLVEDQGPGVPVGERRSIFERARRGSTSDGTAGTGLGLYVAARLMREQGGDLRVAERPGGGASFVLSLPAHRPPPSPEAKKSGRRMQR